MEHLILVDNTDSQIGTEEKVKCHLPNGKLHRAFTIFLFNKEGQLLLTQRSMSKMLWPGDWDGTVASHPRQSENYISSAERRLPEELGVTCKLDYLYKFEYHVPYKDIGSENEICGTLIGILDDPSKIKLVEDEISDIRWITLEQILSEIEKTPQIFCPYRPLKDCPMTVLVCHDSQLRAEIGIVPGAIVWIALKIISVMRGLLIEGTS